VGSFYCSLDADTLGGRTIVRRGALTALTQILEMFDAVKFERRSPNFIVVSPADIWFPVYLDYGRPATQGTTQGVRTRGDVIPPKMSYNRQNWRRSVPFCRIAA